MNRVENKKYSTPYNYDDNYIAIEGKPIIMYLEEWIRAGKCKQLENSSTMLGMYPAWGRELEWEAERAFIYELLYSSDTLNIPILVC